MYGETVRGICARRGCGAAAVNDCSGNQRMQDHTIRHFRYSVAPISVSDQKRCYAIGKPQGCCPSLAPSNAMENTMRFNRNSIGESEKLGLTGGWLLGCKEHVESADENGRER